jgi:hypothetical protein
MTDTDDPPDGHASGGPASYDGAGNIVFPQVEATLRGGGWYSGQGGLASLLALFLKTTLPGEVDLAGLNIKLKEDLPAVIDLSGMPEFDPALTIPLDVSGADEALPGGWVLYGVDGQIVVPEPMTGGLFALGMSLAYLWVRRQY